MTRAFTLLIALLLCAFESESQTINVIDAFCFLGPDVVSFNGPDGGTPQRNIYTGTANNGSFPFRIIWDSGDNRWEIRERSTIKANDAESFEKKTMDQLLADMHLAFAKALGLTHCRTA